MASEGLHKSNLLTAEWLLRAKLFSMCRKESELILYQADPDGLTEALAWGVSACTKMLTSRDEGLSLACTAKLLHLRARYYVRQREMSYALADLAYSFALWPCNIEVTQRQLIGDCTHLVRPLSSTSKRFYVCMYVTLRYDI